MRSKLISTLLILMVVAYKGLGQQIPAQSGQITFERRENVYVILDREFASDGNKDFEDYSKTYKESHGQFKVVDFNLYFTTKGSLYTLASKTGEKKDFLSSFASANTVYTSFINQTVESQKTLYDKTYVIRDSIQHIKWRYTGEIRDIAGYLCRRVNGLTKDSTYVVAFYTDQITTKSGPESFSGLPGMILGIALPDQHVTWFAKSVNLEVEPSTEQLKPKFIGIALNFDQFITLLNENSSLKASSKRNIYIKKRMIW